ncbi:MAG TPA: Clp protease N-terminal domain-containing protein, partial [Pyrinomonadaceae bacterium]|nr:Clp protease N-terminal domain-containing protein [Pyrinomonadaceae bacterium]
MITRELQATLSAAVEEAIDRRHEYVTLEHLLLALLSDRTASNVIRNCGGDTEALRRDLEKFFDERVEQLAD